MGEKDENAVFDQMADNYNDERKAKLMKRGFGALFGVIALFLFALYGVTGLILGIIYFFASVL